jgi:hypothetical protein
MTSMDLFEARLKAINEAGKRLTETSLFKKKEME